MEKRRSSTEVIAEILETAIGGNTISVLSETSGNATINRHLPLLLNRGLLKVKKTEKYFLSKNGREYGLLYITTKKGLVFVKCFRKLSSFLQPFP